MLGRTSTQKRCAAGRDRSGMLGVSITPSRGRGSPRPRRAERLAFSCCRAWMTALAALPLALVFAILVCVPLALRATGLGGSTGRLLIAAYPIAAVAGIFSTVLPASVLAAAIALVWLAFTLVAALHGLTRAFGDRGRIEELCIAVGFMYLAIGGGSVVLWRSGIAVVGRRHRGHDARDALRGRQPARDLCDRARRHGALARDLQRAGLRVLRPPGLERPPNVN